jgi:hypothetical protein
MKKSIILSIIALVVVFGALLIFSGEKQKTPQRVVPKGPEVTKVPEPPAPVAQQPDDPALKDALLGLNKPVAEEVQKPKPMRRRARHVEEIDEPSGPEEPTSLSDYDFQYTVGNWSGVKSCLATNAQRGEEIKGAIAVAFTVGGDGTVKESKVISTSNERAETIAPCVEKKARHIRFPTFAGNDRVTKTAKFVF